MRPILYWIFLCLSLGFFFVAGTAYFLCTNQWIDISVLEQYDPGKPTILLDDEGKEWARFELERREPIAFDQMPEQLIEAFLSAEDWHFYAHNGISWKGILRSLLVNLYHGTKKQGASTITQQLVKLLFFDLKKTFTRKLKEQLYAVIIEQHFTKQQILEIYLNHVYFGCGIYGVQAAAQAFWKKSVAELSIGQAATLAGIIRAPSHYCPLMHPAACEQRRNIVLQLMRNRKVIPQEAYEKESAQPLHVCERINQSYAPHLKEHIRLFLEKLVSKKQLYAGGLVVQTTINRKMQRIAEQEFQKQMSHLKKELNKLVDGGFCAFDVQTGAIRAVVGGADSKESPFNRAYQAKRQMGSVFKPVVYAAALEKGMNFSDIEIDEPIEVVQDNTSWLPNNFDKKFNGILTRAYALSRSNNIVTIKTMLDTGIKNVIAMAERCKLPGPFHPYPSLALGCTDATLMQAGAMINIFANNGVYVEPHAIAWVKDSAGNRIYKHTSQPERVISPRVASQVAKVLMLGLKRVHKWFTNRWFEGEALSKTGTTNDSRTCWYIGSTPTLTTAVYVGCDDNQSMGKNIYPVHTAFPIWLGFNHVFSSPIQQFTFDPSLQLVCIDERSGKSIKPDREGAIEILI